MSENPWDDDPADQLPTAIEPGRIGLTLWTSALGGDPQANDISFEWDGRHTADWLQDISPDAGALSPASSSPVRGVVSWPDGNDVLLTYTWSDFGTHGYRRLGGMAPTSGLPQHWVRLGEALVDLVLLDLGSCSDEDESLAPAYYDTAEEDVIELDDLFRTFLDDVGATKPSPDFDEWLVDKLDSGAYKIADGY
ncbi:MAG: hypothetical protein ACPGVG_17485 [Mycobacterium sp.]